MVGPRQQAQQQQQYRGKSQAEQRQRNHVGQDRQKYPTHKELRNEQEVNSQRFQQEQHETCQHYGMQQNNPQEKQPAPAAEQPWAASPRAHVEFLGGKRARGLVASEAIEASEVIYTEETPLLAVQHEFSRLCGLTCSNCLRFVGSLKDCIRHVLNHAGRHEVLGAVSLIPDGFIKKAGLSLGPVVPCGEAECPAVFCSKRCLEHARQETLHRMVCVEATERTAWLEFLSHARKHHDGLVMAGVCMAQIVFEVIFKGRQFSEVVRPFLEFYSAPWESLAPNRLLANGPPPSGRAPLTETAEGRRSLLVQSLNLLRRVLDAFINRCRCSTLKDTLDSFLQLDTYSRLLGTFSLVCLDVEFQHPLNRSLLDLQRNLCSSGQRRGELSGVHMRGPLPLRERQGPASKQDISADDEQHVQLLGKLLQEVHGITRWYDGDESPDTTETSGIAGTTWEAPLLPFIGWGLFRLGSMTNHSCWPNAEADFPLHSATLEVRALRPIDKGEEVTVSYIEESLPLHQRREALQKRYGFSCTCPRCVVEAAEALLVVMKVPECSDSRKLEELVARRTGLPLTVVSEVRQYSRSLMKPQVSSDKRGYAPHEKLPETAP